MKKVNVIIVSFLLLIISIVVITYVIPYFKPVEITDEKNAYKYTVYGDHVELEKYFGNEEEVIVPDSFYGRPVTVIKMLAFYQEQSIKRVVIPDSVKEIEMSTFSQCTNLEDIKLPSGLRTVSPALFSYCNSLRKIELPESVEVIDTKAFYACDLLEEINIPKNVQVIEGEAFAYCEKLEELDIPQGVNKIDNNAFYLTPWLAKHNEEFVVAGNNVLVRYNGNNAEVNIPEGITYVSERFFAYDSITTKVVVPRSVGEISYEAFRGCDNLEYLVIKNPEAVLGDDIVLDSEKVTIVSVEGSTAQKYAEENGIPWMELQE